MKHLAKRGLALIVAFVLTVSLMPAIHHHTAHAAGTEMEYVYSGDYLYNWGARGKIATCLSPNAEKFYAGEHTYDNLSDLSGGTSSSDAPDSDLYDALQELMTSKHTYETSYEATKTLFQYTDCENSAKTSNKISSFYSGAPIGPEWDGTWNREHTWPNSKGDDSGNGENDIMMLRPTSTVENSGRSNNAYGVSAGFYNPNEKSNGQYDLRGDVARIMLYVYVRWENVGFMWGSEGVIESLDVLLDWMEADPVDTWELGRNDSVESITGTRNVFVDYPELAFLLFGAEVPASMITPSGSTADHVHDFASTVAMAATCTTNGVLIYTCSVCSNSYTEVIFATGHNYVDSICVGCGETKPSEIVAKPVTSVGELSVGDQIIIVAQDYNYALSTTQNGNNRGQAEITKNDDGTITIAENSDVQIITLEAGTKDGTFAFNVGDGYLYAASSSKNYLRTETTLSDNSSWSVTISDGITTVIAQGGNSRNVLQYNQGSSLFACYAGSTQKAIVLYVIDAGENGEDPVCEHTNTTVEGAAEATCTTAGHTGKTVCTDCGKTVSEGETIPALDHDYVEGVCTRCGEEEPKTNPGEATIDLTTKDNRTAYSGEQQVWQQNGITVTNDQAASTNPVGDYAPARFYQGSKLTIEYPGMTKIVFHCNNYKNTYADALVSSIGTVDGVTVTVDGKVVTVEFAAARDSFVIETLTAQVRMDSITVSAGASEAPCEHTNTTVEGAVEATCTTAGHTGKTVCTDCGKTVSEGETIPALDHDYVEGVCTRCGEEEPKTNPGEATIDLTTKDNRTAYSGEQQVWQQNGITVTNDQAASTNPVGDYAPARFYQGSKLTIEYPGMTKIVFHCNNYKNTYADALVSSIGTVDGVTVTVDGKVVTVEFAAARDSFVIETLTAQVRMDSITVSAGASEAPCEHTNTTVEGAVEATCTTAGHTGKTVCTDCGKTVSEGETIPALDHDYDDGVVTTEPTCEKAGVKTYTCERKGCNHSYTEEMAALGHLDENGDNICDRCNEGEELLNGLNKDEDGVWRYYENGEVATDFTGFVKHINGKYYFVNKGIVKKSTGLVKHVNGKYYYIKNGVKTDVTGFIKHTNGKYYYVKNGMLRDDFTGLVKHTNGKYYYVVKGMMRDDYTGLAKHTNKKHYYVENGVWTKVTALVPHSNGKLYYVVDGIFDKTFNGTAKDLDGVEYEVVNGIAQP